MTVNAILNLTDYGKFNQIFRVERLRHSEIFCGVININSQCRKKQDLSCLLCLLPNISKLLEISFTTEIQHTRKNLLF